MENGLRRLAIRSVFGGDPWDHAETPVWLGISADRSVFLLYFRTS